MTLKERINDEMKAALLGGNRFAGEVLRNLKAAILNEEVATGRRNEGLDDSGVEKVVAREVKKRTESAKIYRDNGRPELAEPEEREIEVLKVYLPTQLTEDELTTLVEQKIAELDVSGPQAMGQVIGAIKAEVGNEADGATLANIVKNTLSK
ncbi:GatB/YqeY domain-containing protein [Candidatus Saccharibacteria bacterium oral taxon 955]|nr:GatB/YqeY domain-containing protein [Candidatus Saccharibacteria bacterium oral taxon 955]